MHAISLTLLLMSVLLARVLGQGERRSEGQFGATGMGAHGEVKIAR